MIVFLENICLTPVSLYSNKSRHGYYSDTCRERFIPTKIIFLTNNQIRNQDLSLNTSYKNPQKRLRKTDKYKLE